MNGIDRVMALRAEIIQRSDNLRQVLAPPSSAQPAFGPAVGPAFGDVLASAVESVSAQQASAASLAAAYERGETNDLAAVMIERQKSSLAFEAVLQTRNKLLGAYRDIMNMPV